MMHASSGRHVLAVPAILLLIACDAEAPVAILDPGLDPQFARFALAPPLPAPEDFVDPALDPNPYFPLIPETVWSYRAETDDGLETTVDSVLTETRIVLGIEATIVVDRVYLEGELIELTYDWYAQDTDGNVWYLGEDVCDFEEPGGPCIPSGAWEAGVDGAEAGVVMWADPLALRGRTYRQEYYAGEAEDMAKVLRGDVSVTVPAGTYTSCIETMDFTPLEPGARERKVYCPGTGLVLEVEMSGGRTRNELVAVESP